MADISRREFLKRGILSSMTAGFVLTGAEKAAEASENVERVGTFIDLTVCDGCKGQKTPACVSACRKKNQSRYPVPIKEIPNYWPQNKKEDWSDKKDLITRLTPYNWTTVQKTKVEHEGKEYQLNIPRRCMHCLNPPCAKVCPFGSQTITNEGAVVINPETCMGGAKCRDVCLWGIPARQAGVGPYLKIAPDVAGGGVMYKCDLCIDRIKKKQEPACVEACPKGAIKFGSREEMLKMAEDRAKQIRGFVYGDKVHGGTSTFYVSPVPFEKIDTALKKQKQKQPNPDAPGYPGMPVTTSNFMDTPNGLAAGMLAAPIAGIFAAGYKVYKTMKGEADNDV